MFEIAWESCNLLTRILYLLVKIIINNNGTLNIMKNWHCDNLNLSILLTEFFASAYHL
jgi:hypothetical protein